MKSYRDKELKNLTLMLVFLFLLMCTSVITDLALAENKSMFTMLGSVLESVIISCVVSNFVLICDCIIGSKAKDKLVGLFFIPRAGETIFSRIQKESIRDDRFLISDAKIKYESIITGIPKPRKQKKQYENAHWYRIYLKYQDKGQVSQSHHDYLMCRDLYIGTIGFLCAYLLSWILFPTIVSWSCQFILITIVLAAVFNLCTQLKMNRFVNTVIAVDIGNR